MMTLRALQAIETMLGDDFCHDLEVQKLTGDAAIMQKKIIEAWKIAHAFNTDASCYGTHNDWRKPVYPPPTAK